MGGEKASGSRQDAISDTEAAAWVMDWPISKGPLRPPQTKIPGLLVETGLNCPVLIN
jgi:hypothetical protein